MTIIPGFPQALLDLHHHWHEPSAHSGVGPGRVHAIGTPGGGLEFLTFHHDFMQQVFAWINDPGLGGPGRFSPALDISAWTAVPAELKAPAAGWNMMLEMQEQRITSNSPAFSTADEIGTFIELGIHGWIHGAAATIYGEPVVGGFHSPQSTYFYKIHGLVDHWWRVWEKKQLVVVGNKHIKDIIDNVVVQKQVIKDVLDHKAIEKPLIEKPIKEKDKEKDIFEDFQRPDLEGDPLIQIGQLTRRIQRLEVQTAAVRAFIRPSERPDVGAHLHADAAAPDAEQAGEQ
jgi:hypothetical protein